MQGGGGVREGCEVLTQPGAGSGAGAEERVTPARCVGRALSAQAVSLACICWYLVRALHKRPARAVSCAVSSSPWGLRGTARPARRRERIAARGRRGGAAPAPPRLECHRGVQCDTAPLPAHMPRVDHRGLPGADAADRSDQAADQPRLAPERDRRLRLGLDHGATPRKRPAHRRLHRRADVWQKSDFRRRGLRIFGNGGLTRPRPHHSFLKSCPETNKQSTSRSPRIGHYDIDKFLQARAISIRHLDSVEGLIFLHSIGLPPF